MISPNVKDGGNISLSESGVGEDGDGDGDGEDREDASGEVKE